METRDEQKEDKITGMLGLEFDDDEETKASFDD
jgi:hypothetical protein